MDSLTLADISSWRGGQTPAPRPGRCATNVAAGKSRGRGAASSPSLCGRCGKWLSRRLASGLQKNHIKGRLGCYPTLFLVMVFSVLILLAFGLFVLPGATYSASYIHDLFVYFGGIHRMDHGQLPSMDFYTPLGLLGYYLPYFGYQLVGQFGGAMEVAKVLVLSVAMPMAALALANRVPLVVSTLILVAIFGLIAVPLNLGDGAGLVSQAMFYNRWCWAMLTILFLFAIPPARRSCPGSETCETWWPPFRRTGPITLHCMDGGLRNRFFTPFAFTHRMYA